MDHVIKVTFPAFARMQDAKDHLKRSLTRSIFFICFLVFPSIVGLILIAPLLTQIIPRYEKWEPALLPLSIIGINTVFAAVTTQLTNLLNSIGKIKITFKLMVMWTVLTWIFVPGLAYLYGVTGAAAGYAIVSASSVIAIYIARKYVRFSLKDSVLWPGLGAIIMGVVVYGLRSMLPVRLTSVWILIGAGAITYMASTYLFVGSSLIVDAKKSFRAFISK